VVIALLVVGQVVVAQNDAGATVLRFEPLLDRLATSIDG